MKPAPFIIEAFGGASVLARLLDVDISTVSQWRIRGGRIPSSKQAKILRLAKKLGLQITAEHMVHGSRTP